nr:cyclic AMP-responsive element-binding protein 3-like protein 4 isoform X2 [Doryrhamphus excisus]XP_057909898.1 cyclic AMP-responsive element-binding protein 3-like protein 4 isoform X2 [Doryrhamphus excisus]XP_057909900.1 cyclic AMP-responsive element-binding protein 3-like protein 4 isoform X2 [Doryrhamphus excisus]XP_057909901.1 cyclic AMP-responsive element-binding protein 3-like protein 4 isoform X2 [Doryrhamphus excisus]XP_057909902.1 cyclic AMP-responsive element-binding protein 3-like
MDSESRQLLACNYGDTTAHTWQRDVPLACSALDDSETEHVLQPVNPNHVFGDGSPSESDSGICEDPVVQSPITMVMLNPPSVYQVVYDLNGPGSMKPGQASADIISIELDQWSSQALLSDACVIGEMPPVSGDNAPTPVDLSSWELQLTEEEQKLLSEEGVSLPNQLPLTKAEERILKKVRRKIRNKQSAQDSRRRRKEYIDGLENRAAVCTAQNKELQKKAEQLEKHNISLLSQLRHLQSLIKQTASKAAQTSTCLLIIFVSLSLILLPSLSPISRRSSLDDDYRPSGVLSRNILTDFASSPHKPSESVHPDSSALFNPGQPEAEVKEPGQNLEDVGLQHVQSGNGSIETPSQHNAKLPHTDEM